MISDQQAGQYQDDGFIKVAGLLGRDEALHAREYTLDVLLGNEREDGYSDRLTQLVNCWRIDARMKALTFHANVAAAAEKLAGTPLRLWHDHILAKPAHNNAATEFHQDKPYWPHALEPNHQISAWIALGDVPVEAGCMSFIPGCHKECTDLPAQDLTDPKHLMSLHEAWKWRPRVTHPLQAGDVTFHHGYMPHMAGPNTTDDWRIAHVVIFMPLNTVYTGKRHVTTDPLKEQGQLAAGDMLDHDIFPPVSRFAEMRE